MQMMLADSRRVAEYLGKPHKTVLDKIKQAKCSSEFRQENFWQLNYYSNNNKAKPLFLLTYNGFFLLVSTGFGKKSEEWRKKIFRTISRWEESLEGYIDISKEKNGKPYVESLLEHGKKLYEAGRGIVQKKKGGGANKDSQNAIVLYKNDKAKDSKENSLAQSAIDADWQIIKDEETKKQIDKRERNRLAGKRYRWNKKLVALGLPRIARGETNLPKTFEEYLALQEHESPYNKAKATIKATIEEYQGDFAFKTNDFLEYCGLQAPKECLSDFKKIAIKCFRESSFIYKQTRQDKKYKWMSA